MTNVTNPALAAPHATGWTEEIRASFALGWPLVLTNLAQMGIATTDVVMMGWLGPAALAAGALGANCYFVMFVVGLGLAHATQPMLAQERGRNRFAVRELRRTVRQGFWLCAVAAIPIWLVLWHTESALLAMRQDPVLAREAGDYVRAMQWGLLPFFWFNVLRSFVNALERPGPALGAVILAIVINAALCYALVFGEFGAPRLGLLGAGIASTIANTCMFLALLFYIFIDRRFRRYRLMGRFWRADWPRLRTLVALGIPISVTLGLESTVFNAAAFLQGLIGKDSLAAHAIALQIGAMTFMVPLGFAQAATVRVGLSAGAGDREGVRRAGWTAFALGTGFMAFAALAFTIAPEFFISLFLDPNLPENAAAFALGVVFLKVAGAFQIVDGIQAIGAGALRGLKDIKVPMLLAAFGYWVMGLPLGAALAFWAGWEGLGIWIGFLTGLSTVAFLFLRRFARREALGLI